MEREINYQERIDKLKKNQSDHPYLNAVVELLENKQNATLAQKPYRLLHRLSKLKGIQMHHSVRFVTETHSLKKGEAERLAVDALKQYCFTGIFQVPVYLQLNDDGKFQMYREN